MRTPPRTPPHNLTTLAERAEWLLDRIDDDDEIRIDGVVYDESPAARFGAPLLEALSAWHRGMGSDEYALLSRLMRVYRPGAADHEMDEDEQAVHDWLVEPNETAEKASKEKASKKKASKKKASKKASKKKASRMIGAVRRMAQDDEGFEELAVLADDLAADGDADGLAAAAQHERGRARQYLNLRAQAVRARLSGRISAALTKEAEAAALFGR